MTLIDKAEALAILASAPNAKDGLWAKRKQALYDAIDALPARGVGVPTDAAKIIQKRIDTIIAEEGSQEWDTGVVNLPEWAQTVVEELDGILAALSPTDAAQAREAHLREAAAAVRARYMGDNNREDQEVLRCEAAVLALIGERP